MKRLMLIIAAVAAICAYAAPRSPSHHFAPRPAPRHMPAPRPAVHHPASALRPAVHHHHSSSFWGRGGSNFWPGFVGGVIGSSLIQPAPVIVAPPPPPGPYLRQVWIEGHYETQVINGIYTQVWIPGRWAVVR